MTATTMVAVKTVLIADDTAFVRDRFKTALEGAGHRAVTVRTGQELLAALQAQPQPIDLVVLDLRLPNGRGIDLVRSLRRVAPEKPPIVVFSGTIANAAEVRDLASFGVAGYVNEYTGVSHIMPALAPHLFPEHYNRRSSPRVVLGVPITYRVGNAISTSLTLNVSHGGVAIRTTNPLDVASVVRLRFRLPGTKKEVDAEARVAWSDRRVGMGLQFTSIDPPAQALIDNYVQTHFFSNRKA
ncbi:MAG TPA: PilZ domain-containing protein [Vicinamibacterales bacterium]|nr:PilZ domain-containing protein [Vicinamibacterales bacterium]